MNAVIRRAVASDYAEIQAFYDQLTDDLEKEPEHPHWRKGVYPGEEYLRASIAAGELWVTEEQGNIAAAMVVNSLANEGYRQAEWLTDAVDGEYCVIHTLGVGTAYRGRGLGRNMIQHVLNLARSLGMKSVRLDLIDFNMRVEPVYTRIGFCKCGSLRLFYDAVGWQTFHLYEYVL